jgi:hypothetical protein
MIISASKSSSIRSGSLQDGVMVKRKICIDTTSLVIGFESGLSILTTGREVRAARPGKHPLSNAEFSLDDCGFRSRSWPNLTPLLLATICSSPLRGSS